MGSTHHGQIQRPHLEEWSGETEPPTRVIVDRKVAELYVDVYPPGTNLHDGTVAKADRRVVFWVPEEFQANPLNIGRYACSALEFLAKSESTSR